MNLPEKLKMNLTVDDMIQYGDLDDIVVRNLESLKRTIEELEEEIEDLKSELERIDA